MKNFIYLSMLLIVVNITITAQPAYDSIRVYPGWNLIGSIATGPVDSIMYTFPPNAITSPIYKYTTGDVNRPAGYSIATILDKMGGYWVKADFLAWIYIRFGWGPGSWPNCGTVSYDGKIYNTVVIGDQCWLRQNLDVGTMISGSLNQTNNSVIEKYCYSNDPANCETYGGLYQWNEAMQYVSTSGSQGICPNGWHIPTSAEFTTLKATVENDGNKLKAIGQGTGSGAGTNTSGFSALLAGYRNSVFLDFRQLGSKANFWSSNDVSIGLTADHFELSGLNSTIELGISQMADGLSIRCIKNN